MKKTVTFALRFAIAIAIAATVASLQYLLWHTYGNSNEAPFDPAFSIKGFSYSGYRRGQDPRTGPHPNTDELSRDLELLRKRTDSLRTYGITDLPALLQEAGKHDFQVTAGIWIDEDKNRNETEINALIDAANSMRHVERLIVGNEVMYRAEKEGKTSQVLEQLVGYLQHVRKRVRQPVSTAEQWHVWEAFPELAKHVDYITVHIFPYHEGVGIDGGIQQVFERYDQMVRLFPGRKIVIGEIGWPSKGPVREAAMPSDENQARFVREFLAHPRTPMLDYFLLEAIDQPWKIDSKFGEGWAGA